MMHIIANRPGGSAKIFPLRPTGLPAMPASRPLAPKHPRRPPVCLLLPLLLAACSGHGPEGYQGYAEGEYVRVAAPYAGRLDRLQLQRGATAAKDAPLFVLEQENEAASRREAEERLNASQARLANLQTGRRAPELAAIEAQEAQARAAAALSAAQLQRQKKLFDAGFIGKEALDQVSTAAERDRQRVRELQAQLDTANLPARAQEIQAAEKDVASARAVLEQAQWRLAQKSVAAPVAGLVQDTFYVAGEWVPAGMPVVSLLPPQNIKLRFFVPETAVGGLKTGQDLSATCDGCAAPIPAKISYIAPQAEYTPPVIYSKESRAKLVFLVEARPTPADALKLHPGQPVDVVLK